MLAAETHPGIAVPPRELGRIVAEAARTVETLFLKVRSRIRARKLGESEQHALHALAWFATYASVLTELAAYANRLESEGKLGETEQLLVAIASGEYLHHIIGGMPMNQAEYGRLGELGVSRSELAALSEGRVR